MEVDEEVPVNLNHELRPVQSELYSLDNISKQDKIAYFGTSRPKKHVIEQKFITTKNLQKSTKAQKRQELKQDLKDF